MMQTRFELIADMVETEFNRRGIDAAFRIAYNAFIGWRGDNENGTMYSDMSNIRDYIYKLQNEATHNAA